MKYEVIIIGGGPVGIALGIELGLHHINTLILEKHSQPLHTPRAQSLSARSMEFFLRWGIDKTLEHRLLLPKDLPQTGIWCSNLCGEVYFEGYWGDNKLEKNASPKAGVRSPLWLTEEVLREKLNDFPSIHFLKNHEVRDIQLQTNSLQVLSYNRNNNKTVLHTGSYIACADGASGPSKSILNNHFHPLSEKSKMLGMLFVANDIMSEKKVPNGIMYFIISDEIMAFVGPIHLNEGLWLAQIIWNHTRQEPNNTLLSSLIDKIVGKPINKTIKDYYFWDMQVQLADFCNLNNRIFWLGDSAHAFAPTGGLGLNTGLGDAQNLGWKLASVLRYSSSPTLLSTFEIERRPVWINNLNFAQQNADQFMNLKKLYSQNNDQKAFALAYAELGDRYLSSSGLTLGYGYLDSPLIRLVPQQTTIEDPFKYTPKPLPGYFLPHTLYQNKSIYEKLSSTAWNLIVCGDFDGATSDLDRLLDTIFPLKLQVLNLENSIYPYSYLLVRPDWHIASVGNDLNSIIEVLKELMQ